MAAESYSAEVVQEIFDLHQVADRVRRDPRIARELSVFNLAQGVAARWRETEDMLQASEDVPVAAWIVRKKVEGLIRPDEPDEEVLDYDTSVRPTWLPLLVKQLQDLHDLAQGQFPRIGDSQEVRPAAPVKDPSLWKLVWSYPRLKEKKEPPPRIVERRAEPLQERMMALLQQLDTTPEVCLQMALDGKPRAEWVGNFLAAVHLWHQGRIEAAQEELFGDIWLKHSMPPTP